MIQNHPLEGNKRYFYLIVTTGLNSSTYHTVSTKMKIIIITCRDSSEAKCWIYDHKVAGSNPASEAIKAFIFNEHISRTARWILM